VMRRKYQITRNRVQLHQCRVGPARHQRSPYAAGPGGR
jgi:hypothetical protein